MRGRVIQLVSRRTATKSLSAPSAATLSSSTTLSAETPPTPQVRLSKSLAEALAISRRSAERHIRGGDVTIAGKVVLQPHLLIDKATDSVRCLGKTVQLWQNRNDSDSNRASKGKLNNTKVWMVHKLAGEMVAESDPRNRPLLLERLHGLGVHRRRQRNKDGTTSTQTHRSHLKPIGRLDFSTEGLILLTNDGDYARQMELPSTQMHRTYRVRVHGRIDQSKINRIERGMVIPSSSSSSANNEGWSGGDMRYRGMKVHVETPRKRKMNSTNQWIQITCTEGKNRQIRNVLKYLGLQVTRLIRTGYGDYSLQKIPPGMAVEVAAKPVEKQKNRGPLWPSRSKLHAQRSKRAEEENNQDRAPPVQWVRHSTESFSKRRAAMTGVSRRNFHQSARPVQNGSSRWWFLPFLVCAAILGRPTASFDWHKASAVTRRHLIHTLASGFVVGTTSCPVQALPNFLPPTENRPQISLPTAIPNNMKQPMVQGLVYFKNPRQERPSPDAVILITAQTLNDPPSMVFAAKIPLASQSLPLQFQFPEPTNAPMTDLVVRASVCFPEDIDRSKRLCDVPLLSGSGVAKALHFPSPDDPDQTVTLRAGVSIGL